MKQPLQTVRFCALQSGGAQDFRLAFEDGVVVTVRNRAWAVDALAQYLGLVRPGKAWGKGLPKGYRLQAEPLLVAAPDTETVAMPVVEPDPPATGKQVGLKGMREVLHIEGVLGAHSIRLRKWVGVEDKTKSWLPVPAPIYERSTDFKPWVNIDREEFGRMAGALLASY
jgi:hypothetical protein